MCLVVLALVAFGVSWLRTSRLGSAMLAVRADERSAAAAGINVVRVKLIGFALAAFIAGLGGSLLAYQLGNVTFEDFDAFLGLVLFSVVVVAGITSVSGGILAGIITSGGILVTVISSNVGQGGVDNWYGVVAGIGVILTVIFNPEGIVGPDPPRARATTRARASWPGPVGRSCRASRTTSETHVDAEPTPAGLASVSAEGRRNWSATRPWSEPTGNAQGRDAPVTRPDRPLLEVQDLTVRYGGVVAVDKVSFAVEDGCRSSGSSARTAPARRRRSTRCAVSTATSGIGRPRRAGRRRAGAAPAGRPRARPHLPAGRGLRRPHRRGERAGRPAPGHERRPRGADRGSSTSSGSPSCATCRSPLLSQGQRQLVSIARALAGEPRLLLLDEPAAGLDSTESLWLADRLRDVRDSGVTILLVDHDMSLVLNLCDTDRRARLRCADRSGNTRARSGRTSRCRPPTSVRPTSGWWRRERPHGRDAPVAPTGRTPAGTPCSSARASTSATAS